MKRAAIACAIFAALILTLGLSAPAWLAITGSVMALAGTGAGGFLYQARRHMVRQWGNIPAAETCEECKGVGVLDKNKQPIDWQDMRVRSHTLWARGNNRTCRQCQGRGYYTPRVARKNANKKPGPVTVLGGESSPEDVELVFPEGPEGPQVIQPTKIFPPGWEKKGGKK